MKPGEKAERIAEGIRKFFGRAGKESVVLGLSGGIDSALTLVLLVRALGKENVTCILMPNTSITEQANTRDAKNLAESLGVKHFVVPIDRILESFPLPWKQSPVAGANLNARARALILYNYANSFDVLVAGTGNKSEFYLGYFTKYGDAAADFFPLGSLLKKEVRELAAELKLPKEFLEKKPSAELWKGQEDEKELGLTYGEIDELLPLILSGKGVPEEKRAVAERIERIIRETEHKRKSPEII